MIPVIPQACIRRVPSQTLTMQLLSTSIYLLHLFHLTSIISYHVWMLFPLTGLYSSIKSKVGT